MSVVFDDESELNTAAIPGGSQAAGRSSSKSQSSSSLHHRNNSAVPNSPSVSSTIPETPAEEEPDNTYDEIPLSVDQETTVPPPLSQTAEHQDNVRDVEVTTEISQSSSTSKLQEPGLSRPVAVPRTPRRHDAPPSKRQSQPSLEVHLVPSETSESECDLCVAEWDCVADADNELTFEKGERLLIVSRQYEALGWLVAQRTGVGGYSGRRTGLVPKNYVTKIDNN